MALIGVGNVVLGLVRWDMIRQYSWQAMSLRRLDR